MGKNMTTCCTILLILPVFRCIAQSPVFLVHPVSTAGVDGSTVEFTCTANNTELINYRVNGTSASEIAVISKGFNQIAQSTVDGVATRVLSVTVSSQYNNTEILCRAIGEDNIIKSYAAILAVQGPLSSVIDLSYSFIDSSTVNISWSPPFTLLGTNITGYNISATSNGTTTNYFTSDSYHELLLTDLTDSPCNEIIITVSGYNGLDGENESLTGIYLPSATFDNPVRMFTTINNELALSVMFDVSNLCVGQYPKKATFFYFVNGSLGTHISSSFVLWDNFTIHNILTLSEDIAYTLVASLSNLVGIAFNYNSTVTFNTTSILSVAITDTTDGRVCVECVFASFSTDSVCTVELVSNNTVLQYTETFSRSSTDSTVASGCISDVISGVYTVRILNGRGKAVDLSLLPSNVTVTNITITDPPTIPISESPNESSDESPSIITVGSKDDDGDYNVGAIAGGVTAGVFGVLVITGSCTVVGLIVWRSSKNKESADLGSSAVKSQSHNKPSKDDCGVYHRDSTDSRKPLMHSPKELTFDETIPEKKVILPDVINKPAENDYQQISTEPANRLYATLVSVEQEKSTHSSQTNSVSNQIEYAQLNLENQVRAGLPYQPVDYCEVDHNKTAQQQNHISSLSPFPVHPRSKESHFLL